MGKLGASGHEKGKREIMMFEACRILNRVGVLCGGEPLWWSVKLSDFNLKKWHKQIVSPW